MPETVESSAVWVGDSQWTAQSIQALVDPEKQPTLEQVAVIEGPLRPTLVVAGAGSGKTETMSMRVLWLVANQGILPERILGLTFTRKAAGELSERLRARLSVLAETISQLNVEETPTVSTYNSFAQRIVKEHGWRLGYSQDVRLIGEAAAIQLMTTIVREQDVEHLPERELSTIVSECHNLAGKLAEHGISLDTARQEFDLIDDLIALTSEKNNGYYADGANMMDAMERRRQYLGVVREFAARKQRMGVIDFADQLAIATRLVTGYPEVVEAIRSEFDAVLLDEFQDTSVIQMTLFSEIFGSHKGRALAVTAVGDPNQAIYGWRGASSASLEDFIVAFDAGVDSAPALTEEEQIKKTREQTLTLSTAWRNDKQILFAANVLSAPLARASERVVVKPLEPRPGAGIGQVNCKYLSTSEQEAQYVAEVFSHTVSAWEKQCDEARRLGKKLPNRPSMAVLAKRRRDFDRFAYALRQKGLPIQIFDSGGLLEHPTIKRLVSALRASSDVADTPSLLYLIDKLRLGASDMTLLWEWAQKQARSQSAHNISVSEPGGTTEHPLYQPERWDSAALLMEAIDSPPPSGWQPRPDGPAFTEEARSRVLVLGQRLRLLRSASAYGIETFVERAISIFGLVQDSLADHTRSNGRDVLDAFMDIVIDYATGNEWADIPGFLTWLDIAHDKERGLPSPGADPIDGAVHIMTIHGSKGLEWDVVAVVGMSDGAFPQHRSTSKLRRLVKHPGYYSVDPNDVWKDSGWATKANELPYDMRGDASVLPPFDAAFYVMSGGGADKTVSFKQWYDTFFRAQVGQHMEREQRRLAYVAVTRARHTLLLTGNWLDTPGGRAPSIYLHEVLRSMHMRVLEKTASEAPTPDLRADWDNSWIALLPMEQRRILHQEWGHSLKEWNDTEASIAQAKEAGQSEEAAKPTFFYPAPSTPEQRAVEQAVHSIMEHARTLPEQIDILELLHHDDDLMMRHIAAIIAEHRRAQETAIQRLELSAMPATSVAALLEDRDAFALRMRRPLPARPSSSASLGTLIHSWVERQLRQLTGELWLEPISGVELLNTREQERLQKMQNNFSAYELPGKILTLEEPFSVNVHGVTIQGRIDAIFTGQGGDIIVDWKSGRFPQRTDIHQLRYFRDQLELYRQAWAARQGYDPDNVSARLFFLEHGQELGLDTINRWLDAQDNEPSLSDNIAMALSIEDIA